MPFTLPPLKYKYDALEPTIDEETMKFHHDQHHATYVKNLNEVVKELPDEFQDMNLIELAANINLIPEENRNTVKFNAGGHLNHSLFWQFMRPGGSEEPAGKLAAAIKKNFGNFEKMKEEFEEAASKLYGSGWVWIVVDGNGVVKIITTANQDSPYTQGLVPLLGWDSWEHSWYLKYGPDKAKYLSAWWDVVNWDKVSEIYEAFKL